MTLHLSRSFLHAVGALTLAATIGACGKSSDGGGGGDKNPQPTPPDVDATYYLDGGHITGRGSDLTHDTKPVLWTYALTVDGELRSSKADATSEEFRNDLATQPVKGSSYVRFEVTVRNHKGAKPALATNLKAHADEAATTAAIWDSGCLKVTPDISLFDEATVVDIDGKKRLRLDIQLCDFAKVLVSPTVGVKPAQIKDDPRLVVYECAMGNKSDYVNLGHLLYAYNPYRAACKVGYSKPRTNAVLTGSLIKNADGTMKSIEIPKGMVNEPFEVATGNQFIDYLPNAGAAKRFKMVDPDLSGNSDQPLPLGRFRDCTGMEVQAMYKDSASAANGTMKESRLTFQRSFDSQSATLVWVADDQTPIPNATAITAADQAENRFWLFCTWDNKLGVDVVTVAPEAQ